MVKVKTESVEQDEGRTDSSFVTGWSLFLPPCFIVADHNAFYFGPKIPQLQLLKLMSSKCNAVPFRQDVSCKGFAPVGERVKLDQGCNVPSSVCLCCTPWEDARKRACQMQDANFSKLFLCLCRNQKQKSALGMRSICLSCQETLDATDWTSWFLTNRRTAKMHEETKNKKALLSAKQAVLSTKQAFACHLQQKFNFKYLQKILN